MGIKKRRDNNTQLSYDRQWERKGKEELRKMREREREGEREREKEREREREKERERERV